MNSAISFRPTRLGELNPAGRLASLLLLFLLGGTAIAQGNPLRADEPSYLQQILPRLQQLELDSKAAEARVADSGHRADNASDRTWTQMESHVRRPMPDDSTAGTTYLTSQPTPSPAEIRASDSTQTTIKSSGERRPFAGVESLQVSSTLQKIALNTGLVIVASLALMVVVRRSWPGAKPLNRPAASVIRVEQSLNLGGKAELKVVRCGLNQVLVAIDAGGIKSVVPLEPALNVEEEIAEAAEPAVNPPFKEPVNIEQFVQRIKAMESEFMRERTTANRATARPAVASGI